MEEQKTVADTTSASSTSDQNDKIFGVLAYIGILWLVPLLAAPKSKFAKYHANQGLVYLFLKLSWDSLRSFQCSAG